MIRRLAVAAIVAAAASACAVFPDCTDYVSKDDMLDSWLGSNLRDYERQLGVRPFETLQRPQNETEYSYITRDEYFPPTQYTAAETYRCVERLTVDNGTGDVVAWAYEGNGCYGYCRSYD